METNLSKINDRLRRKAENRENHLNSVSQRMRILESPEKNFERERLAKEVNEKELEKLSMHLGNLENKINHGNRKYEQRIETIKKNIGINFLFY